MRTSFQVDKIASPEYLINKKSAYVHGLELRIKLSPNIDPTTLITIYMK